MNGEPPPTGLQRLVGRVTSWRPVRVLNHFAATGGAILAGGMTYQAVFAIFAALWVGFSIAGLWLAANPELMNSLFDIINRSVPGLIGTGGLIDPNVLRGAGVLTWTGAVALVGLLGTTLGWLSTTTQAIRTIFRMDRDTTFFILVKLRELGLGILFGLALVVSALISLASTAALGAIFGLLGVSRDSFWFTLAARAIGLAIVLLIDTATLAALFRVLSRVRIPLRQLVRGSLLGAGALGALKALGGALLGGAGANPLLATFAVLIGLLIWFNLMNSVILLTASWIAVGLEDAGIPTRPADSGQAAGQAAEQARREADAFRVAALAELRDARLAHDTARWYRGWSTGRRLRAAEARASKYRADSPG